MLTGVGGGVMRDVLAAEVPLIFRSEVYAVASMLGAIIVIVASQTGFSGIPGDSCSPFDFHSTDGECSEGMEDSSCETPAAPHLRSKVSAITTSTFRGGKTKRYDKS